MLLPPDCQPPDRGVAAGAAARGSAGGAARDRPAAAGGAGAGAAGGRPGRGECGDDLWLAARLPGLAVRQPGLSHPAGSTGPADQGAEAAPGGLVSAGPEAAGYPTGCWNGAVVQDLLQREFGVRYNVHYVAELLRNLGFS